MGNRISRLIGIALLSVTALVTGRVLGQSPVPPGPRKVYTNRTAFKLPLRVEEKDRPRLQQVQLYVRNGSMGTWTLKESVPPTQTEFIYRVTQDGEYWFTVVTVDKLGAKNPADVNQEPPGLIVVVDRQPPEVDVHPTTSTFGQPVLQCDVRDANPDPSKVKVEIQTADQTWQPLDPLPGQANQFRVPDPGALRGVVRAQVTDLAGNTATREIHLQMPAVAAAATADAAPSLPPPMESKSEKISPPPLSVPASTRQFINSKHATLRYQIDQAGPSGIAKVEVWMTRDEGQTWQRLCEDPDRQSPVEIDLPGDGTYGLSLVVTGNNGNGGGPPARGETPDWRLEVDTTKPEARILAVRPEPGEGPGVFLITWTAQDRNLKPEPIDLEYATQSDGGAWILIAKGLKNDGNYRWTMPHGLTGEVQVRMRVTDMAGNTTTCTAPQPVVMDHSRPKAKVVGVVAGASEPSGS
jgi:hypothetical protein